MIKINDEYQGDTEDLRRSIHTLILLSDNGKSNKLSGHARSIMAAAYHRLAPKKKVRNKSNKQGNDAG